jgi:hypothetical protein
MAAVNRRALPKWSSLSRGLLDKGTGKSDVAAHFRGGGHQIRSVQSKTCGIIRKLRIDGVFQVSRGMNHRSGFRRAYPGCPVP